MSKFRKKLVENKGFTLIELLVVIAILGILAAVAIPRLTGFTDRAREANLEAGGQSIRSNVELYIAENGDLPDVTELENTSSDYYVNIDDDYTLTLDTDDVNSYVYTLDDDNSSYSATITPGGVSVTSSP